MAKNEEAPAFLQDLKDNVINVALTLGIDAKAANELAYEIARKQRAIWGGHLVYFPSTDPEELTKRDEEIWEEFNGSNHSELVTKFNVSLQHIYRIIKVMRSKDSAKRQGNLL